jgi:hypothetical protein
MESIISIRGKKDMTPVVRERLLNCRDGEVIRFEPGEYHFYSGFAFEKYYYISNNRHGLKHIAFPIIGKKNVTIDGTGANFIFHGEIIPFAVEDSEDVTLKNFSIDWVRPFYSQGEVAGVEPDGVTVQIDRNRYPYRVENDRIVFEGEGWESPLKEGVFEVDAETRAPAYLSGDSLRLGFPDSLAVREVGSNQILLTDAFPHVPKIGNSLIFRHYLRNCPGIFLKQSKYIQLEDVTLYHAGGMGVIGQFCENVTLSRCRVSPAAGRIFSVMVDATHFVNCRGDILLEDSLFEGQLDDPSNVHGINTRISEVLDERSLITELVHHEQHGVEVAFPGDRIRFSDNHTLLGYAEGEVDSIERINAQFCRVIFKEDLPERIVPGHVLENMSWTPNVHITGCTCRNNRARGWLVSTPGKVVIENNRIESSGAGIKISGDANYWFESGAVRDVLICNNEFGDCCFGSPEWGRAVIDIDPEISNPWKNQECFHRNIRIENNRFFTFDAGILFARAVDGITFKNNAIRRTDTYAPVGRTRAALTFEACRNIDVGGNNLDDSFTGEWMREVKNAAEISL